MTSESATSITLHLLIDTGMLWHAGSSFQKHPDFRKLLRYAKPADPDERRLKICVSHIGWEERRTQLVEAAKSKLRSVTTAFGGLIRELENNIVSNGLAPPALTTWKDGEIEAHSKEAMKTVHKQVKIGATAGTNQTVKLPHGCSLFICGARFWLLRPFGIVAERVSWNFRQLSPPRAGRRLKASAMRTTG